MFKQINILFLRNFKMFFKDPRRIFFVLMSPLFVLLIFILFTKEFYQDQVPNIAFATNDVIWNNLFSNFQDDHALQSKLDQVSIQHFIGLMKLNLNPDQNVQLNYLNKLYDWKVIWPLINSEISKNYAEYNSLSINEVIKTVDMNQIILKNRNELSINDLYNPLLKNLNFSGIFNNSNIMQKMYLAKLNNPQLENTTIYQTIFNQDIIDKINSFIKVTKNQYSDTSLLITLLTITSLTTAISLCSIMVEDQQKKVLNDFYITPMRSSLVRISYLLFNILLNTFISAIILLIALIYIAADQNFLFTPLIILKIFCAMFFGVLINSSIWNFIFSFVKNLGVFSALSASISAGGGFIIGAYIPLAQLPGWLQQIASILPSTQITNLITYATLNDIAMFKPILDTNPAILFGTTPEIWYIILYLSVWLVFILGINFFINANQKRR
ncbi:ABC transporter permease [Mycoplasma buteonis]|uniref:ABC transporter permease n=1 Tax=Mycoplasma buteonis TaxID=171280 RepID=UPI000568F702|nr:ABC transporter permease [Mycoplasma buteonis]